MKKPLLLMILDGFGLTLNKEGNAVLKADPKTINTLMKTHPTTTLKCSGLDVGLPPGQMGNSEVGHTNIGAGRIVYQDLTRINVDIQNDSFFENDAIKTVMNYCERGGAPLHLIGLLSDGGVHSHINHLFALLSMAKQIGVSRVFIHPVFDGRDTPPKSGIDYLKQLQDKIEELKIGEVVTITGRYYAMDRDKRYERIELAYNAIALGDGEEFFSPKEYILKSYSEGVTDEFFLPAVRDEYTGMEEDDGVIFFNFRPDRAREITRAFCDETFEGFERKKGRIPLHYVCFTEYDETMPNCDVAFPPEKIEMSLGEYISQMGLTQLRIAETEKYAHVTFFLNGGEETVFPGEDRELIQSPKVATYDLMPEMSAYEVTDEVIRRIESGKYDLIVLNYANCDMVGHTGIFEAAVKAVLTVDECAARVLKVMKDRGGITLITADHGNSEKMLADDGMTPFTAHTTNEVPLILVGKEEELLPGRLCDISPTILDLLNLPKPSQMTGNSLIKK